MRFFYLWFIRRSKCHNIDYLSITFCYRREVLKTYCLYQEYKYLVKVFKEHCVKWLLKDSSKYWFKVSELMKMMWWFVSTVTNLIMQRYCFTMRLAKVISRRFLYLKSIRMTKTIKRTFNSSFFYSDLIMFRLTEERWKCFYQDFFVPYKLTSIIKVKGAGV